MDAGVGRERPADGTQLIATPASPPEYVRGAVRRGQRPTKNDSLASIDGSLFPEGGGSDLGAESLGDDRDSALRIRRARQQSAGSSLQSIPGTPALDTPGRFSTTPRAQPQPTTGPEGSSSVPSQPLPDQFRRLSSTGAQITEFHRSSPRASPKIGSSLSGRLPSHHSLHHRPSARRSDLPHGGIDRQLSGPSSDFAYALAGHQIDSQAEPFSRQPDHSRFWEQEGHQAVRARVQGQSPEQERFVRQLRAASSIHSGGKSRPSSRRGF